MPTGHKIYWSQNEIELLKQIGNSKKISQIQKDHFPLHSIEQLSRKRAELGITIAKNIPYEQWELDIIKEKYQKADKVEDFIHLLKAGRHRSQVVIQANKMGLYKQIEYNKNREYFDEPNLENCSIAGFIAADGNVYKNRLTIKLANKDHDFLCKIRDSIGYSGPISVVDRVIEVKVHPEYQYPARVAKYSILQVSCPEYIEPLSKNWNIIPNKSLILKCPNIKNYEQCLAYLAGLINGDGSVSLLKSPKSKMGKFLDINITGTKEICEWVKFMCDLIAPYSSKALSNIFVSETGKRGSAVTYHIGGSRAVIIAQEVLKLQDKILLLNRKWDNARNYIKEQESIEKYMLTQESLEKNISYITQNRHLFEEKISQYNKNGLLSFNNT